MLFHNPFPLLRVDVWPSDFTLSVFRWPRHPLPANHTTKPLTWGQVSSDSGLINSSIWIYISNLKTCRWGRIKWGRSSSLETNCHQFGFGASSPASFHSISIWAARDQVHLFSTVYEGADICETLYQASRKDFTLDSLDESSQ